MRLPTIWLPRNQVNVPLDEVVLTFDDGPNGEADTTSRLLDVLDEADVRAAFCVCGVNAVTSPELIRRMAGGGHLIVNHTFAHRLLPLWREDWLESEVDACSDAIRNALGDNQFSIDCFRPPFGLFTSGVRRILARRQLRLSPISAFAWDTRFGAGGAVIVLRRLLEAARRDRGGILVLHDGLMSSWPSVNGRGVAPYSNADRSWVPDAVKVLIRELRSSGLRIREPVSSEQ
jgi:peptidoglycan/xylan/chitin deacetylase (PgdA/CDA1 family)